MKYSLRSLMIVAAFAPPLLAVVCSWIYILRTWPHLPKDYPPLDDGRISQEYLDELYLKANPDYRPWHFQLACFVIVVGIIAFAVFTYKAFKAR